MHSALLAAPVSRLTGRDIAACLELAVARDWPPEAEKWRILLAVGDGFGIRAPDSGRLIATVVVTRYERRLAAIGMLLVDPACARLGVGARLMRHALDHTGPAASFLHATEPGEPLYRRLGFRAVLPVVRHRGHYLATGHHDPRIRTSEPADLAGILRVDHAAFGVSRAEVLTHHLTRAAHGCVVADGDTIRGYAAAWHNLDTMVIGPVIAEDDRTAAGLIHALATRTSGDVTVDLAGTVTTLSTWLGRRGLRPQPPVPLMTSNGQPLPGARDRLYSPIMQALG